MKIRNLYFGSLLLALLWSCGKDDSPTPEPKPAENNAPKIEAQSFTVAEDISDATTIGTVKATDEDQDELTFSITANDDNLFEITDSGALSLASGKSLDASAKAQHVITVSVDDGEDTASAQMTIKVTAIVPENTVPEIQDQEFSAKEDITDADGIGQVEATDADGDTLTYEITENDNDIFFISDTGALTLAEGKTLDYETQTSHSITVSVSDGEASVTAMITITVENVIESMAEDPASFVTTWKTTMDNEEIQIGLNPNYAYDFTIDWGDGAIEDIVGTDLSTIKHMYETAGIYTVSIKGSFPTIIMTDVANGMEDKLISIERWGDIEWKSFKNAFFNCDKLVSNALDAPNLENATNLAGMFLDATSINSDFSNWDTSTITNMSGLFEGATSFNGDVSTWNMSNVNTAEAMFFGASSFDQDLSGWNLNSMETMGGMFNNSGMSPANLSATLIGWANFVEQNEGPANVTLGIENLLMCGQEADDAYNFLKWTAGWNIVGLIEINPECN